MSGGANRNECFAMAIEISLVGKKEANPLMEFSRQNIISGRDDSWEERVERQLRTRASG